MEDMTGAVVPEEMVVGGPGLGAESAGPVVVVGSGEESSGPMGLEGAVKKRKDMTGAVVPEGMVVGGPGLGAESARPVVVVGSGEESSGPMGLEAAVKKRKDMTGTVVPEGMVVGGRGLGAESAGPVVVVGSGEESSGPMGLKGAAKKRKGRHRKYEFDGDRVGLSSSMPESLPKRGPGRPRGSGRRQFLASMESARPVVVVGSGEESSGPMGLEGAVKKTKDMTGTVVPEGMVVGGPGLGAESAGPVMVVGSGEESSGPMGLKGTAKKRKGRPRKYAFDGDRVGLLSSMPESLPKRGPGRPRGSGRRQFLTFMGDFAAETAGGNFTSHVFTVRTGEDIVSKIPSFFQGPRVVCILAATGVLSSVIIHQPEPFGGPTKYDGHFEILTLTGSYTFSETGGRNGSLSISMSKPNGEVLGGGVASSLIANGPIQLIFASFKQNISKELKRRHSAESSAAASIPCVSDLPRVPSHISKMTNGDDSGATPTSTFSEPVCGGDVDFFALNQNMDPPSPRPLHQIPDKRPFPDINASLP